MIDSRRTLQNAAADSRGGGGSGDNFDKYN